MHIYAHAYTYAHTCAHILTHSCTCIHTVILGSFTASMLGRRWGGCFPCAFPRPHPQLITGRSQTAKRVFTQPPSYAPATRARVPLAAADPLVPRVCPEGPIPDWERVRASGLALSGRMEIPQVSQEIIPATNYHFYLFASLGLILGDPLESRCREAAAGLLCLLRFSRALAGEPRGGRPSACSLPLSFTPSVSEGVPRPSAHPQAVSPAQPTPPW